GGERLRETDADRYASDGRPNIGRNDVADAQRAAAGAELADRSGRLQQPIVVDVARRVVALAFGSKGVDQALPVDRVARFDGVPDRKLEVCDGVPCQHDLAVQP